MPIRSIIKVYRHHRSRALIKRRNTKSSGHSETTEKVEISKTMYILSRSFVRGMVNVEIALGKPSAW